MEIQFDFNKRFTKQRLQEFADLLMRFQRRIGFKVSSRGWCYIMEQNNYIDKSQFDKVEENINRCRKEGLIPVDFVADEAARAFTNIQTPSTETTNDLLRRMLADVNEGYNYFTPDWWDGEEYYIQMLVEKVDLMTLFLPVCKQYKIPIANSKGWSSILQRAEYAKRFKEAQDNGLKCVLLYCGDHDPDGLRISDTLRKNLEQVQDVYWSDDTTGYNPEDLIIDRFGLNYNFITQQGYTWIDNLITGGSKNLASPEHPNFKLPYVQNYLRTIGERKCEANVVVTSPQAARQLVVDAIEQYLGEDALERFDEKRRVVREAYETELEQYGIKEVIDRFLDDTL